MHPIFQVHMLNENGINRANRIAQLFDNLLMDISEYIGDSRESAIVKTKLEEACFFAKKAMANKPENQKESDAAPAV